MSTRTLAPLCRILLAALVMALLSSGLSAQQDTQQRTTAQRGQYSSTNPDSSTSGTSTTASSQDQTPASKPSGSTAEYGPARWAIFGGYSWLDPGGSIGTTKLDSNRGGFTVSASYFFNKYAGFQLESGTSIGGSFLSANQPANKAIADITTLLFGPVFRFPTDNVTPFIHGLVGLHRLHPGDHGVAAGQTRNGVGLEVGGGLDLNTWTRHLNVRIFEADYQYAHESFFPIVPRTNLGSTKLSGGLVFLFGDMAPPVAPSAACAASPSEVFPGEPVAVTVTPTNFNPKRSLTYSYTVSGGGAADGTGATTNVKTDNLAPGSYTVSSRVSDGKKGTAECSANFSVKQIPGPTISCSANPTAVETNGSSTITCQAASPVNRPVTVKHTASAGTVSPADAATTTLNSNGVDPGSITVTSVVSDDKGQTATATTAVTVNAPRAPEAIKSPEAENIGTLEFKSWPHHPEYTYIDNDMKAKLDDVALRLQRDPNARLVVIGNTDPEDGRNADQRARERSMNAKRDLVDRKGIDPTRIETRISSSGGRTDVLWFVPQGATPNLEGTQVITDAGKPAPAPVKRPVKRAVKRPVKKP